MEHGTLVMLGLSPSLLGGGTPGNPPHTEHHLPVDHAGQCRQHGRLVCHASHGSQVLPSLLPHVQGAGHLGCGWPLPGKTSPIKRGF